MTPPPHRLCWQLFSRRFPWDVGHSAFRKDAGPICLYTPTRPPIVRCSHKVFHYKYTDYVYRTFTSTLKLSERSKCRDFSAITLLRLFEEKGVLTAVWLAMGTFVTGDRGDLRLRFWRSQPSKHHPGQIVTGSASDM